MADNAKNYSPQLNDSAFDIVAVAASAGGLNAVSEILSTLPATFSAAIAIVQHLSARYPSVMAEILNRKTALKVKQAEEGDNLAPGTVYISPPDRHLLVNNGALSLSYAESVRFLRPCADLLFESVALNYKERAIALVLSGTGNDGSIGIGYIKTMGGTVIAQDKKTAEFFGMPSAAIQTGNVDFILPLDEISNVLMTLVMGQFEEGERGKGKG